MSKTFLEAFNTIVGIIFAILSLIVFGVVLSNYIMEGTQPTNMQILIIIMGTMELNHNLIKNIVSK